MVRAAKRHRPAGRAGPAPYEAVALREQDEVLDAIRRGEVDALVRPGPHGEQVFTRAGTDLTYRAMVETMAEGAVALSTEGDILYCNARFAELVAAEGAERIIGVPLTAFVAQADAAQAESLLRRARAEPARGDLVLRRADGTLLPVHVTLRSVAGHGVPGIVAVVTDLSELRRGEEALARQAELLARTNRALRAIYAVNEAVLHAETADGLLQRACDLAIEVGGYHMAWIGVAERSAGKPVRPVAHAGHDGVYLRTANITWADEPRGRGPTGRAIREGTPQVARFIMSDPAMAPWRESAAQRGYASSAALPLRLDGETYGAVMIYSGQPDAFDDDELRLLAAMAEDIGFGLSTLKARADIRQLNAELEQRVAQRTAQLDAANKDLEGFAYSVSHDLRAPLRAINGFSRILLEDHAHGLDEDGQRLLDTVCRNTETMSRLIDDILEFSRAGRRELHLADVDVAALTREVLAELLPAARERKVELRIAPLPHAQADPSMLRQVLVNLLSNAIKFTGPRPSALIEVNGELTGANTAYAIRDNGVGFNPEYAHKLFGVFERLHGADEFPGTGIGLAIVKRIVDKHGGRVWAESRPGEGATFHFALPASVPAAAPGDSR